ncbi:MAG: hypothetical protein WC985_03225 [Thermoplasmata archaeon]
MRPLTITGTDGKERTVPLQEPTALLVLSYLRGSDPIDATPYLLSFIGELGAAKPRRSGEAHLDYAGKVLKALEWAPLWRVIRAAELCWNDAIAEHRAAFGPTAEEIEEAGKSSTATGETPSSPS